MRQTKSKITCDLRLQPNGEPLYKRLPTHDEDGNFLSDFMMLIPGLRHSSASRLQQLLDGLHAALGEHRDVVYADLNAPRNLLWVSVRTRHGVINELAAAIRLHVPEAKLVGHPAWDLPRAASPARRLKAMRERIRRRLRLNSDR